MVVHGSGGFERNIHTRSDNDLRNREWERCGSTKSIRRNSDFRYQRFQDLLGGDHAVNAAILTKIFNGERGPCRDITVLNAGAALMVTGIASTMTTASGSTGSHRRRECP